MPDHVAGGSGIKKAHRTEFIEGVYFFSADRKKEHYMTIDEYVSRDRPLEI